MPGHRIVLVAIHSLQIDRLAIDQQPAATDLDLPESDPVAAGLEACPWSFLRSSTRVYRCGVSAVQWAGFSTRTAVLRSCRWPCASS